MSKIGQVDLAVHVRHHRFVLQGVANEDDPGLPGFLVERLPLPVGPHVPVNDIDIAVGIDVLEFQRTLHRMGAADAAAVGTLRLPGTHALNENGGLDVLEGGVLFPEPAIQFLMGHDSGILAEEVFIGLKFLAAGSDNGDPVLHRFPARRRFESWS